MKIWIRQLERVPTGYSADAVVLDGPAGDAALDRTARITPAAEVIARRAAQQ